MPPQITCASALPGKMGKHENHIFHSIGLCNTHNAPVRCLPERKKMSSVMCLIASTFVEIVRYLINVVHCLLLQAWRRTTPIFHTATDSVTDLVNTEHLGNRQQDAMLPFLGPVCTHSIAPTLKGGSTLIRWYFTVFRVFWSKSMQHLSEKTISGFPVSLGSAEALVRWGGKIKCILIAYFLGNICAIDCHNRAVYVKIIASQR